MNLLYLINRGLYPAVTFAVLLLLKFLGYHSIITEYSKDFSTIVLFSVILLGGKEAKYYNTDITKGSRQIKLGLIFVFAFIASLIFILIGKLSVWTCFAGFAYFFFRLEMIQLHLKERWFFASTVESIAFLLVMVLMVFDVMSFKALFWVYAPFLLATRFVNIAVSSLHDSFSDFTDLLVGISTPLYRWMLFTLIANDYVSTSGSELVLILKLFGFIATIIAFIGQRRIVQGFFRNSAFNYEIRRNLNSDIKLVVGVFIGISLVSIFLVDAMSTRIYVWIIVSELVSSLVMYSGLILIIENKSKFLVWFEVLPLVLFLFIDKTLIYLLLYYMFVNVTRLIFINSKNRIDWLSYRL